MAIIGGGISSACLALALINRGYRVTLYCKDEQLSIGASGNRQGALYPLLNQQHDALSHLFANSFLYARNYVGYINQTHPFDYDLSGLLQLYYDESASVKLDKIIQANLPLSLVKKVTPLETDRLANISIGQSALYYPLAGWVSPAQMVDAIFKKAQQNGQLQIKFNHCLDAFEETTGGWLCHFGEKTVTHKILALTTAMHTLDFKQSEALPLSANDEDK
ncbi:FAD-dependent 5-carboxymethylaminomethyl-2-thiouridine(34) oxidoreductase MnmC [Psychromonas sp. KJ10-10]|uniref:FAD-dependent 5-carboxymethylaminomethyl-2-thiouridine(34) oxidoreductase MnmC n=1 Tax=Psychromonas sp. KJ10-10 TaxID=3391823 RepID=UPI0039B385CC